MLASKSAIANSSGRVPGFKIREARANWFGFRARSEIDVCSIINLCFGVENDLGVEIGDSEVELFGYEISDAKFKVW